MKIIKENKSLNESFSEEDRAKALAEYLDIDVEDITNTYDNVFETTDGEEYYVVDENEAYQLAKEDIENLFDDLGLDSFTESFQQWILDNAVEDNGWFSDALREMEESYVEDIKYEGEDRLIEELIDAEIVESAEEYHEDEEGAEEKYVEYLIENAGDPVEFYRDNFGEKEFSDIVKDNNFIDIDAVAEECINVDGIAHFIARYDGDELDLGNGLFAYRIN